MPNFQLFILETIGTQELILVGLVALIVFGPRKLPQMARKFGGMLTELRKVSNDFRQTWEREASLDEDSFKSREQTVPAISPAPKEQYPGLSSPLGDEEKEADAVPEIREMSREDFENASRPLLEESAAAMDPDREPEDTAGDTDDKRNWL